MAEEKTCFNCKHDPKEEYEEPCVNCRHAQTFIERCINEKPLLWEPKEGQKDNVNHPAHYESGKYECIDVMTEAIGLEDTKGFCLCNAFKYIYRCTKKHYTPIEDVKKAIWYLNKFLELAGEEDD